MPSSRALRTICSLRDLVECRGKDILLCPPRHDTNAVEIREHDVAGFHAHAFNLHGHTEVEDLAARTLVLRIASQGEGGEPQGLRCLVCRGSTHG